MLTAASCVISSDQAPYIRVVLGDLEQFGAAEPMQQVRTVSYGREKPFCREPEEACWSSNRRAHFAITDRR